MTRLKPYLTIFAFSVLAIPMLAAEAEDKTPKEAPSTETSPGAPRVSLLRIPAPSDFEGEWQRTDGPYTLTISKYDSKKQTVEVTYANPNPIHVETAQFERKGYQWVLEILLKDEGYEGSKYMLGYTFDGPALMGIYTVGQTQQTYEVSFVPKKDEAKPE